jgi:hypothetical protein
MKLFGKKNVEKISPEVYWKLKAQLLEIAGKEEKLAQAAAELRKHKLAVMVAAGLDADGSYTLTDADCSVTKHVEQDKK